jgi:hypothetical protein
MCTDLHHNAVKAAMQVVVQETQKDQRKVSAVIMHRYIAWYLCQALSIEVCCIGVIFHETA